jgi:hypothetical protein
VNAWSISSAARVGADTTARNPAAHRSAGQVTSRRRSALLGYPVAATGTVRDAMECLAPHQQVAFGREALDIANC